MIYKSQDLSIALFRAINTKGFKNRINMTPHSHTIWNWQSHIKCYELTVLNSTIRSTMSKPSNISWSTTQHLKPSHCATIQKDLAVSMATQLGVLISRRTLETYKPMLSLLSTTSSRTISSFFNSSVQLLVFEIVSLLIILISSAFHCVCIYFWVSLFRSFCHTNLFKRKLTHPRSAIKKLWQRDILSETSEKNM